jgi:hypothetical protein
MGSFRTIREVEGGYEVHIGANTYPDEKATFRAMEEVEDFIKDYCDRAYANTFENWTRQQAAKVAAVDRMIDQLKVERDALACASWPGSLTKRGEK